jgi:hypothetical protein
MILVSDQQLEEHDHEVEAEHERELYEGLSRQINWSCTDGCYQAGGSKVCEAPS